MDRDNSKNLGNSALGESDAAKGWAAKAKAKFVKS